MAFDVTQASGFIFDCDGTLLDSMPAWNETEARLAEMADRPLTPEDTVAVRALPITQAAEIFARYGVAPTGTEVLNIIDDMLLDFYGTSVTPRPGAVEFVQKVRRAGVPCTVVSSSPLRYIQAGLENNGLGESFVEIISTDTVGLSKQDARIYEYAIGKMGAQKATTWGVDDALYAVRVMADAGLHTIGAYDCDETAESYAALVEASDVCVRSLEELL